MLEELKCWKNYSGLTTRLGKQEIKTSRLETFTIYLYPHLPNICIYVYRLNRPAE